MQISHTRCKHTPSQSLATKASRISPLAETEADPDLEEAAGQRDRRRVDEQQPEEVGLLWSGEWGQGTRGGGHGVRRQAGGGGVPAGGGG